MTTARIAWEHTHREMLAAVVALNVLRRRGFKTVLEHVSALGSAALDAKEVVFLPFYYDDLIRDRYLTRRELKGAWLVNLAYEQMHFRCGRGYLLPDGAFAREELLHCAWGPRFETLLLEHGIPRERIRVTGHPRFDIYHHRELLLGRQQLSRRYGLDADKPWVLVPYNFNMAYISPQLRAQLVARKYALTDEFVAGFAKARDAFTTMVRRLADTFPDIEFVLRVHPAGYESKALYEGETRTRKNLHAIAEYDIANWICEAALTIVWNSTSAMEAMVAGRPVVSYEPFPFSGPFEYDVNKILPTFTTEDEVVNVIRALPDPTLTYDWSLFEQWYQHRDGRCLERLADIVAECDADPERYRCRQSVATTPRVWLGRRLERVAGKAAGKLFQLDSPPPHAAPAPEALARAVRELSPEPLDAFLR
ncbi:MAG TPA: surface carbohydrate biosynthesis protein [Polyangiaceae bacterium]|nr:surface carbohydrate biosynthesis protein [Polyangiaceae bacterium]